MKRRTFLRLGLLNALGFAARAAEAADAKPRRITVEAADCAFDREPLARPFGFKGGYLSELWQVDVCLRSARQHGIGLGTQSTLWSDASVFSSMPEAAGNGLMFALTRQACRLARGASFASPMELTDALFPEVFAYGKKIAGNPNLRATFALNALVPLDCAAWVLFARENTIRSFDGLVPDSCKSALAAHHPRIGSIPLLSYAVPVPEIRKLAADGFFFLKIKIGQPGTQEEMLAKDMARLSVIHDALKDCRTPHTENGKLVYYLDANGRYEKKETLLRLVDHLRKIGAYGQVAIVEEPFDEKADIDVHDIPLRLAADESAHTVKDAETRMDMGYRAMTLKPIAKTLSVTLRIAAAARRRGIPCFCADLTVNPVLVEWNKAFAARLSAFPGLGDLGLVETNGDQNYVNWKKMRQDLAYPAAPWAEPRHGIFELDADYYAKNGGLFEPVPRLEKRFGITSSS